MNDSLNDDLQRQLMALFVAEAQEHIQTINQNLLALEDRPGEGAYSQLLTDTLREAHSLKGAARAVNLAEIESIAHQMESIFVELQNTKQPMVAEGFDVLYQALDAIGTLVKKATGENTPAVNVNSLRSSLEKLLEGIESAKAAPPGRISNRRPDGDKGSKPAQGSQTEENDPPFSAATDKPLRSSTSGSARAKSSQKLPDTPPQESHSQDSLPVNQAPPGQESPPVPGEARRQEETVRLTTTKLDTLLSLMGELQVTRIGTGQRLVELLELQESISSWEIEWRKTRPSFRHILITTDTKLFQNGIAQEDKSRGVVNPGSYQPMLDFLQSNENHLRALGEKVADLIQIFKADSRRMDQVAAEMEEEIRQTRMLPISTVFNTFPRMVRDLARDKGKSVALVIQGGETDVDRSVLEQIKDAILHILRNCIDHGIEMPEERAKAGKPSQGTIHLRAAHQGDSLVIEVADDGTGIDLSTLRASAVKKRLLTEEAAEGLSDRDALWLIFHSGFSTSPIITDISGRGVGLDIVRDRVEHLHGLIDVENDPGNGIRFVISVPLTVATTLCLLVQAGKRRIPGHDPLHTFAIPISNVVRLIRLAPEDIGSVEGHQAIRLNGEPVALWRLADVLGLDSPVADKSDSMRPAVVVGVAEKRMAFWVDAVIGTQEMVIKTLPWPLIRVRNAAGASILGNGEVVVVLNTTDMLSSAERHQPGLASAVVTAGLSEEKAPVIMVADNSITTRTLEKNILEASGYRVLSAADGLDAWTQMQTEYCDLLVSDVVMPRLDGFGLTEKLRTDERYKQLPIVLVTSLDRPEDRERGVQAGADAYIVKSAFDQEKLLDTIRRLI